MIDFSSLRRESSFGRLLRRPLAWIPKQAVVPVLQGSLRGAKWVVGAGTHGCWLGSYEADKQRVLVESLGSRDVFYDIGANVGFYSLLASRIVGPSGEVHAFEPVPANLDFLRRHKALNDADNVRIHELALSDAPGEMRFARIGSRSEGRLSDEGDLSVKVDTVDALVEAGLTPPTIIKMDIEGGEAGALRGAAKTLSEHRPLIYVATHGPEVHDETITLLRDAGYTVSDMNGGPISTDELRAEFVKTESR